MRKVDFGESSRIITLLTPQRGIVPCMVRGSRRKGSPLAALFDTFNHVDASLLWRESRNVQTLTDAAALNTYGVIKSDILRHACASVVLETAMISSLEGCPNPELFQETLRGLEALNNIQTTPLTETVTSLYLILQTAGIIPGEETFDDLPRVKSYPGQKTRAVKRALRHLEKKEQPPEETQHHLLEYLHDYTTHHFEKKLRSTSFLKSLL